MLKYKHDEEINLIYLQRQCILIEVCIILSVNVILPFVPVAGFMRRNTI